MEVIYVLEGTLEYRVEGRSPVTLKSGGVLFIPAGTRFAAANPLSTEVCYKLFFFNSLTA
ncbi:cupin domain-containing protein [Puia sp.]|uniref:cupin domain-containing protein n=1 Tax=Puia sp. TaxID=2045100 RepID=UPI002D8009A4|nr:cupin domain-containing protein [Puia sp.]